MDLWNDFWWGITRKESNYWGVWRSMLDGPVCHVWTMPPQPRPCCRLAMVNRWSEPFVGTQPRPSILAQVWNKRRVESPSESYFFPALHQSPPILLAVLVGVSCIKQPTWANLPVICRWFPGKLPTPMRMMQIERRKTQEMCLGEAWGPLSKVLPPSYVWWVVIPMNYITSINPNVKLDL